MIGDTAQNNRDRGDRGRRQPGSRDRDGTGGTGGERRGHARHDRPATRPRRESARPIPVARVVVFGRADRRGRDHRRRHDGDPARAGVGRGHERRPRAIRRRATHEGGGGRRAARRGNRDPTRGDRDHDRTTVTRTTHANTTTSPGRAAPGKRPGERGQARTTREQAAPAAKPGQREERPGARGERQGTAARDSGSPASPSRRGEQSRETNATRPSSQGRTAHQPGRATRRDASRARPGSEGRAARGNGIPGMVGPSRMPKGPKAFLNVDRD